MGKTCIKCGYTRRESDTVAPYACPACGIVYAKAEAAHAEQLAARARADALAQQQAAAASPASAPAPVGATASPSADALMQQMLLARSGETRGKSPYRGMALAVLIAFSAGFASAAVIYSGVARLAKQPAAALQAQACTERSR